jgi:hypothetical protein
MNSTELSLDETHFNSIPVSIHYAEQGLAKTVYTHRVYTIYIHHIYIIYMVLTNPTLNTIKYPCCITELYQVHTQVHYWTVSAYWGALLNCIRWILRCILRCITELYQVHKGENVAISTKHDDTSILLGLTPQVSICAHRWASALTHRWASALTS